MLDGEFVSVASRGTGGPQGRPAKASEFVRAIHGCLRATSSHSPAATGYSPSPCAMLAD